MQPPQKTVARGAKKCRDGNNFCGPAAGRGTGGEKRRREGGGRGEREKGGWGVGRGTMGLLIGFSGQAHAKQGPESWALQGLPSTRLEGQKQNILIRLRGMASEEPCCVPTGKGGYTI